MTIAASNILKNVTYLSHSDMGTMSGWRPGLGNIQFTWNDDEYSTVWVYTQVNTFNCPKGYLFLEFQVDYGNDNSGIESTLLHHGVNQNYPRSRARLIWNALIQDGWVPQKEMPYGMAT